MRKIALFFTALIVLATMTPASSTQAESPSSYRAYCGVDYFAGRSPEPDQYGWYIYYHQPIGDFDFSRNTWDSPKFAKYKLGKYLQNHPEIICWNRTWR